MNPDGLGLETLLTHYAEEEKTKRPIPAAAITTTIMPASITQRRRTTFAAGESLLELWVVDHYDTEKTPWLVTGPCSESFLVKLPCLFVRERTRKGEELRKGQKLVLTLSSAAQRRVPRKWFGSLSQDHSARSKVHRFPPAPHSSRRRASRAA